MKKMRRRGNSAAAWSLAIVLSLLAGAARAQSTTDQAAAAEALFREGRALAEQGKHAEACPKFAASQRLDPGYGTLWNLAECLSRVGRTASAWATFREAADVAKKAGQADREAKATRRAAELEPKLEHMTLSVKAPALGLAVKRGGVVIDPGAWGTALPVDPGTHRVEASASGKTPFSVEVETAGPGQTVTVEIPPLADARSGVMLAPTARGPIRTPKPAPAAASPHNDDGASTRRALALAAGGVGLAGVVVGSIFGLSASSKWSDAQDLHCRTDTLCDGEGVALTSDAKTAATTSTVGFIVGGAGVAAGVTLFLTTLGKRSPSASKLLVAPAIASSGSGVEVRGRF